MHKSGIYKITSPTNKVYIGESINLKNRKTKYKGLNCKRQPAIYNSLKKHGFDTHSFDIIEYCEPSKLKERERYWQDYYNVLGKNGLNCVLTGTDEKKPVISLNTKRKISVSNKGVPKNMSKKGIQNIKDSNSIPVVQINNKGDMVNVFPSAAEAARAINVEKSGITSCTNGINKTSGGYAWIKEVDYDPVKNYAYKFNRKKHKVKQKEFFIPHNTPSSKNSKRWTGKMLISSKTVMNWKNITKEYWIDNKEVFKEAIKNKEKPLKIGFHFVRNSLRKYDWVNPLQTVQDEMVKNGWVDDDNVFELIPFPYKKNGKYTTLDRENPGVYIKVF